jgi:hypothetical protein
MQMMDAAEPDHVQLVLSIVTVRMVRFDLLGPTIDAGKLGEPT